MSLIEKGMVLQNKTCSFGRQKGKFCFVIHDLIFVGVYLIDLQINIHLLEIIFQSINI